MIILLKLSKKPFSTILLLFIIVNKSSEKIKSFSSLKSRVPILFEESGFGTTLQSGSIIEAFSNCDAGLSLAIGSVVALVIGGVYYMITGVTSFKDITDSFTQGFKAMVPSILILTFAWTISGIMGAKGGYLDAQAFVAANVA